MTIKLVTAIKRYVGLSADTKPEAPIGSTFFETDTGSMYILDSAGAWVVKDDHVQLMGSNAEKESAQDTQVATIVQPYAAAAGATQMEVFVESGSVRVRTDGEACTATTGEPLGAGFVGKWNVTSLSVYYVEGSTITVVSR